MLLEAKIRAEFSKQALPHEWIRITRNCMRTEIEIMNVSNVVYGVLTDDDADKVEETMTQLLTSLRRY